MFGKAAVLCVCVYYAAGLSHSRGDMFASERMYTQDQRSCLFAYNPLPSSNLS
jgi:hypothetical protein